MEGGFREESYVQLELRPHRRSEASIETERGLGHPDPPLRRFSLKRRLLAALRANIDPLRTFARQVRQDRRGRERRRT